MALKSSWVFPDKWQSAALLKLSFIWADWFNTITAGMSSYKPSLRENISKDRSSFSPEVSVSRWTWVQSHIEHKHVMWQAANAHLAWIGNAMQVWIFNIFKIWQEHNISSCRGRSFCIVFQALKWNSFCTFDNENASEGMRQPNASGVQCVYEFVIVRRCVLDASSKEQKHNALFSPIFQRFQV